MMPPHTHRAGRALTAALALAGAVALLTGPPASADPPRSRITEIYDADRCGSQVCGPGDPTLKPGASITGMIQVHVHSEATFGLEWVRLQAHVDGTPASLWICLQQWRPAAGSLSYQDHYTWDSRVWPDPATAESDCEHATKHYHSEATKNALYTLRVIARERPPDRDLETESPGFEVRLRNPPVAPQWAGDPSVSTGSTPAVTLRWKANPEERTQPSPDIVEYHFVREGPGGDHQEFAVNATDPGRQGCQRLSSLYQCKDTTFDTSGRYRYALIAFRAGAGRGAACATAAGTCVESPLSSVHAASITVGSPGTPSVLATDTPSAGPSPTASASASTFPIAPVEVAPPADRSEQLAAASDGGGTGAPAVPVAAGLVLLLTAAHVFRSLRGSR
ncbi:MAG TPA: hypothetical protein VGB52_11090 [Actinomycetota bacterium]